MNKIFANTRFHPGKVVIVLKLTKNNVSKIKVLNTSAKMSTAQWIMFDLVYMNYKAMTTDLWIKKYVYIFLLYIHNIERL